MINYIPLIVNKNIADPKASQSDRTQMLDSVTRGGEEIDTENGESKSLINKSKDEVKSKFV